MHRNHGHPEDPLASLDKLAGPGIQVLTVDDLFGRKVDEVKVTVDLKSLSSPEFPMELREFVVRAVGDALQKVYPKGPALMDLTFKFSDGLGDRAEEFPWYTADDHGRWLGTVQPIAVALFEELKKLREQHKFPTKAQKEELFFWKSWLHSLRGCC